MVCEWFLPGRAGSAQELGSDSRGAGTGRREHLESARHSGQQRRGLTQIAVEGKRGELIAQHLVQQQLFVACWDPKLEQWIFGFSGVRAGTAPLVTSCVVTAKSKPFSPCQKNLWILLFP